MEFHSETGIVINQPMEIDFSNPEQSFATPHLARLRTWLRRARYDAVKVVLKFKPGIFLFSELTWDDRDTGVYNSRYISKLSILDSDHNIDWAKATAVVDRKELRPVPDTMTAYLEKQCNVADLDFLALTESFLRFISEQSSLQILVNENYGIYSSIGESVEEFSKVCLDIASLQKSEKALSLAAIVDREMRQNIDGMFHALDRELENKRDVVRSRIEDFELACKRLLNKAISLHVLDVHHGENGSSRATDYNDALIAESNTILETLDSFQDEFRKSSDDLIVRFGEIESIANGEALDINIIEIPPSSCSLQLIRVSEVWLPFWSVRYSADGTEKEKSIKAF